MDCSGHFIHISEIAKQLKCILGEIFFPTGKCRNVERQYEWQANDDFDAEVDGDDDVYSYDELELEE